MKVAIQVVVSIIACTTICDSVLLSNTHEITRQPVVATSSEVEEYPTSRIKGNPEEVIASMRKSPHDADVQKLGCSMVDGIARPVGYEFEHLVCNKEQDKFLSLGADKLIIDAMRRFPEDTSLLAPCISALSGMAQWNAPVYGVMGEHGAIEAIANAIKHNSNSMDILRTAGCLGSFTDFQDEGAAKNLDRTAKTNVTTEILHAMSEYIDNGGVILQGLCYFSNACRPPALNVQMVDAGYLEDSVIMMQKHKRDRPGVRGEVIWVNDECFVPKVEYRNRLAKAGYLQEVIDTMQSINNGTKEDVLLNSRTFANACNTLVLYAEDDAAHKAAIKEAGGVDTIKQGTEMHNVDDNSKCSQLLKTLRE